MYKICFVTTVSMTLKAFVIELAKTMYKEGEFEIHFVCDNDEQFKKMLPDYIHFHPIAMKRGISLDGIKAIKAMERLFKKEQFDLVQYSTPNASCYASIAAMRTKIPVRLYCQWGIAYVGFQGFKRKIFKIIEKFVCNNSTMIEPDSLGNLNFGRNENLYGEKNSHIIWNGSASGVNLKKFDISKKKIWCKEIREKYDIPMDALVYIFIGRITRDKGINELFEASKKLLKSRPNVYLLLVGNKEVNESVDQSLYRWSLESDRVIYSGFTSEVEKYLAASDVYVLPSYREGFGSAVIEAEAMGVPVIVSDIPGPTDAMVNEKTGILTPKANASELYANMLYLCESSKLREQYGNNGVMFVKDTFEQGELFKRIIADRFELLYHGFS